MNEAYIKAVCRLSQRGINDPTAQIAELQGEIDYYRNKVQALQEYIVNTNPQAKESIDALVEAMPKLVQAIVENMPKLVQDYVAAQVKDTNMEG